MKNLLYKKVDGFYTPVDLVEAKYIFLKYVSKLGKIHSIVTDINVDDITIDVYVNVDGNHYHFYYFIDGSYELSLNGNMIAYG